ncbi:MAG: class I SAM-dependent methyltransferase [Planctomycetota bacterium]
MSRRDAPMDLEHPEVAELIDELPFWSSTFVAGLLDRVPMTPGLTWLDVGAGTGFLTVELAQRCGDGTRVIAVDPWEAAAARLRRRVAWLGLENVEIVSRAVEHAGLLDGSVDVAVANLALTNFADPTAALRGVARALKPGGRFYTSTNPVGHMAELYAAFRETLIEVGLPETVAALDAHEAHRGTAASWSKQLADCGLVVHEQSSDAWRMRFADGGAFLRHGFIRLGFLSAWQQIVAEAAWPQVLAALRRRLNALAAARGELALTIPVLWLVAHRAEA